MTDDLTIPPMPPGLHSRVATPFGYIGQVTGISGDMLTVECGRRRDAIPARFCQRISWINPPRPVLVAQGARA